MDIEKYTPTEISKKLYKLLKNFRDDENFIFGVLTQLETDDQRNIIISEIEKGQKNGGELILLAYFLSQGYLE